MRNLKRVLSLTLALMMALSVMAFSSSASAAESKSFAVASDSFSDYDAVTPEFYEAIDITTALNIARGDETGALNPSEKLTRAEATAILARMLLGANADNLNNVGASTVFTDVAYDHWAASYINYCTNQGIISGMTATTFSPSGDLTGAAFGKMLLVALGYNADTEKYKGDGWETNVAIGLANAGIKVDGLDLNASLTREAAMEMTFQTLTADMVSYGGFVGTIGGQPIILGSGVANRVPWSDDEDYNSTTDGIKQFCEQYFPKLTLDTTAHDNFGRPAPAWNLDGEEISRYTSTAVQTYTDKVTAGTGTSATATTLRNLGLTGYTLATYDHDDDPATPEVNIPAVINGLPSAPLASVAYIQTLTDKGRQVEVYTNGKTITDVVVIDTYVGEITAFTEGRGDANASVTVGDINGTDLADLTLSNYNFETDAFSGSDVTNATVVLVTICSEDGVNQKIGSVEAASSETIIPTYRNASPAPGYFRVGSTTYNYSVNYDSTISATDVTGGVEKIIYLDNYGYVISVANPSAGAVSYAVVLGTGESGLIDKSVYARLLFADGTVEDVQVDKYTAADSTETAINTEGNLTGCVNLGDIVSYTVSDGVYQLTEGAGLIDSSDGNTNAVNIERGNPTISVAGVATYTANSKTIFLVNTATSGKADYVAYTGIANVPSISAYKDTVSVLDDSGVAVVVYVSSGAVSSDSSVETLVFVAHNSENTINVTNVTYYEYNAIVDGESTTVMSKTQIAADKLYTSVSYDDDGYLVPAKCVEASAANIATTGTGLIAGAGYTKPSNNIVNLDTDGTERTWYYDENTLVFTVNNQGKISATTMSKLDVDPNNVLTAYATKYTLDVLFITEVADPVSSDAGLKNLTGVFADEDEGGDDVANIVVTSGRTAAGKTYVDVTFGAVTGSLENGDTITVTATDSNLNDSNATLDAGNKEIVFTWDGTSWSATGSIKVTAEDETEVTYEGGTCKSSDATLSTTSVDGVGGNSNSGTYTTGQYGSAQASVTGSGNTATYKITITKPNGGTPSANDTMTYTLLKNYGSGNVAITITYDSGDWALEELAGDDKDEIEVTAEDGTTKITYKVELQ